METEWLTSTEAAVIVGVNRKTLKRWARAGGVPGAWQTPGGSWRFSPNGLAELTAQRSA